MKRINQLIVVSGFLIIITACTSQVPSATGTQSTTTPAASANTTPITTLPPQTSPPQTSPITTAVPTTTPATTAAIQPKAETTFYFTAKGKEEGIDLDLDGTRESIGLSQKDLTINGVSFRSVVEEDFFADEDPVLDNFLITDLNYKDQQIELGLMVRGPSDDPAVMFYTYKDRKLIKLGRVPTDLTYEKMKHFDGEGHIFGVMRLSILQTWFGEAEWRLTEANKIELTPDQIFKAVVFGQPEPVELIDSLPIYREKGDTAPHKELMPQQVEFLSTDNKLWVEIKGLKDGTAGWFKVKDFDHIVDLDNKLAGKVFRNLLSAD